MRLDQGIASRVSVSSTPTIQLLLLAGLRYGAMLRNGASNWRGAVCTARGFKIHFPRRSMVGKPADRACVHPFEEPFPLESSGRRDRSRTD